MADAFSFETIDTERVARAALTFVAPPEDASTGHVLRTTGSGLATLDLALRDEPIAGLTRSEALLWRRRFDTADLRQIESGLDLDRERGLQILTPEDAEWPASLSRLGPREPYALWVTGDADLLAAPANSRTALIGAYAATEYGTDWAARAAAELTEDGYVVTATSGEGIATSAAQGVLDANGHPVVVVPRPLTALGSLDAEVARKGVLMNEIPPVSSMTRKAALSSHWLLAGLSGVFTVVEAREHSTAVQTARLARGLGREVAAVPADVTRNRQGTNRLIADGTATLVTDAEDVERLLEQQGPQRTALGLDLAAVGHRFDHGVKAERHVGR